MDQFNVSSKNQNQDYSKNPSKTLGNQNLGSQMASQEDEFTHRLEEQTSKVSSGSWIALAVGSMVASAAIALVSERKEYANFVGLWAPSLLLIGIYNKIVKIEKSSMPSEFNRKAA